MQCRFRARPKISSHNSRSDLGWIWLMRIRIGQDQVDNICPFSLLWGGWQERLRHGREQENWTYAIDLGKVLDRLNLELFEQ